MEKEIKPKVTLVGAGPGDPELLTVKAIHALGEADVVIYDALVNREVLRFAPVHSKRIFAGKRKGSHSLTQTEINRLIVEEAFSSGHVVRLKGGDPFVFGRGGEEIEYVQSFGIETSVVPGVSSSIAVAANAGIPVTHRGIADSFWVITGTKQDGSISDDLHLAAGSNATVVVLMGLNKLKEISAIYRAAGKERTSVAVISNGTLPNENVVLGDFSNIVALCEEEHIKAPAVIIIGEVVRYHRYYDILKTEHLHLKG